MNKEIRDYITRMVPDIARKCGCKDEDVWAEIKELSIATINIDADAMVKELIADIPSDCSFGALYRKGIEDTLKKIKREV